MTTEIYTVTIRFHPSCLLCDSQLLKKYMFMLVVSWRIYKIESVTGYIVLTKKVEVEKKKSDPGETL